MNVLRAGQILRTRIGAAIFAAALFGTGGIVSPQVWAQEKSTIGSGVFRALKVGQKVSLTDKGTSGIEIQLLNDGAIGTHTVIEVGATYIVLDDIVSVSRQWIPVTALRGVVWTRIPQVPSPGVSR